MDAKAKVVAWRIEYEGAGSIITTDQGDAGSASSMEYVVTPLVTLTDHEAALADLRGKLNDALGATHGYMQALAAVEQKHQTLLTGLEALAGELDADSEIALRSGEGDKWAAYGNAATRIRTLASAGLEGKQSTETNEEERI